MSLKPNSQSHNCSHSQSHKSPTPESQFLKLPESQEPNSIVAMAQSPRHSDTIAKRHSGTIARYTVAQSPRYTLAQVFRARHLLFLGNLLQLPTNESSSSSFSSSVRVEHQRVVWVVQQRVVRVGGPNVTAACPYPALRLDKLDAALIRCLVL